MQAAEAEIYNALAGAKEGPQQLILASAYALLNAEFASPYKLTSAVEGITRDRQRLDHLIRDSLDRIERLDLSR